ncbi:Hypothetical protein CINCED_3A000035 [Cinara cedri]|uniref:Uncharacterized protein n=1 Tax=Cinara cedri TaxID=506608 RepID=A0A5E4NN99_9HEMI|nr:Hypothetical protein CINCED_3A000035 [Cinara cedri]
MSFKHFPFVGAATLTLAIMAMAVTAVEDATAEDTAAEPSLYSAAYLPHNPYESAVASTSTNIIRAPGNLGHVAAFHKTVETPFSSVHKSDVRFTNDVQPYPYAAGPHPYVAGPHPYAAGPYPYAAGPHPYVAAAGPYPYASAATGPYPYAAAPIKAHGYVPVKAHGYVQAAPLPYGYGPVTAPVVTPHSVSHASFSGPYGSHYSYRR